MIAAHSPAAVAAAASANVTDVTPAPSTPSTATVAPRRTPPPGSSSPSAPSTASRRSPAATNGRTCPATSRNRARAPSLRTGSAAVTPRPYRTYVRYGKRALIVGSYWTGEGLYSRPRASKDQPASSP